MNKKKKKKFSMYKYTYYMQIINIIYRKYVSFLKNEKNKIKIAKLDYYASKHIYIICIYIYAYVYIYIYKYIYKYMHAYAYFFTYI